MTRTEALLHPVRARIVALLHGGALPPGEIAARLGDVPLASVYRHLARLAETGLIEPRGEEPRRGPSARTYAIARAANAFDDRDRAALDGAGFAELVALLTGIVADEARRFGASPGFSAEAGVASAAVKRIALTDAEHAEFRAAIRTLLEKADREPPPDASPRLYGVFSLPLPAERSAGD